MSGIRETEDLPDITDIHLARARIRERVSLTPVLSDAGLNQLLGCRLFCKCENLQRTGAFKFRGACNAIARLREAEVAGDIATHSSGNHGAALALAARLDGRMAHVVMPENASPIKMEAVRRHGGEIHLCAPTQKDREAGLQQLVDAGYIAIPPYDHADIIAGQGTAALELMQAHSDLEILLAPVGGGGLLGGTAIAGASFGAAIYAAEPEGAADTAASLAQGKRVESWQPETIADGLRALVGVRNFALIKRHVRDVLTVSDDEIRAGMRLFWQHTRLLIEPSSAVVIAAISKHPEVFAGHKVGAIITGANIDPADWIRLTGESP